MTDLKYCKNCKHCRPEIAEIIFTLGFGDGLEYARCVRPRDNDLVSGKCAQRFCFCERISYSTIDTCGRDAKYYCEARK